MSFSGAKAKHFAHRKVSHKKPALRNFKNWHSVGTLSRFQMQKSSCARGEQDTGTCP